MGGGFSQQVWMGWLTEGAGLFLRDTDTLRTLLSHHGLFLKQHQVQLPEQVAEMFEQLLASGEEEQERQVGTDTSGKSEALEALHRCGCALVGCGNQGKGGQSVVNQPWGLREICPVLHPTGKGTLKVPTLYASQGLEQAHPFALVQAIMRLLSSSFSVTFIMNDVF